MRLEYILIRVKKQWSSHSIHSIQLVEYLYICETMLDQKIPPQNMKEFLWNKFKSN